MQIYLNCILWITIVHGVLGQVLQLPSHTFNTSSPVSQGPYVIGQILPCTYRLFPNVDTNGLDLLITLQTVGGFATVSSPSSNNNGTAMAGGATETAAAENNGTYVISDHPDVSRGDAYFKQEGNLTYFEHSINFNIPLTVKPGNYKVVYTDRSTNTNLAIPIEIRPAAPTPSHVSGASPSGLGTNHSPGSIFTGDGSGAAASMTMDTSTRYLLVSFILFALSSTLL